MVSFLKVCVRMERVLLHTFVKQEIFAAWATLVPFLPLICEMRTSNPSLQLHHVPRDQFRTESVQMASVRLTMSVLLAISVALLVQRHVSNGLFKPINIAYSKRPRKR